MRGKASTQREREREDAPSSLRVTLGQVHFWSPVDDFQHTAHRGWVLYLGREGRSGGWERRILGGYPTRNVSQCQNLKELSFVGFTATPWDSFSTQVLGIQRMKDCCLKKGKSVRGPSSLEGCLAKSERTPAAITTPHTCI